jgi:hypothetical protein
MNCLLIIGGVDDLATAGTFSPQAWGTGGCFIPDDRMSSSDCLAAERAGATDYL